MPWPNILAPSYTLDYTSVAPWLTFGATPATCTCGGVRPILCARSQHPSWAGWSNRWRSIPSVPTICSTAQAQRCTARTTSLPGTAAARSTSPWPPWGLRKRRCRTSSVLQPALHISSVRLPTTAATHTTTSAVPSVMDANPVFTSGSSLDYAERNPGFIVRVGTGGTNGMNIGFSADGGQTWAPGATQPSGAVRRDRGCGR